MQCHICGTWMQQRGASDPSGHVCYAYWYCPECEKEEQK